MPTGYTDMIDINPQMTTKQWVMEGLARAFGVCVTLRGDSFNLTEEQIKQKIATGGKHDVDWHQKELDRAKKEKEKLSTRTEEQWKTAWAESEATKISQNKKSIAEAKIMKERHAQKLKDLDLILASSEVDKFTKDVAKFGVQQLNLVASECEPYITEPVSLSAYKTNTLESNIHDIEYHTDELTKAKERMNERIALYSTLKKDLDIVLDGKT